MEHTQTAHGRASLAWLRAWLGRATVLAVGHALAVFWAVRAFSGGGSVLDLVAGGLLGVALCDAVTLLVHWTVDNHFTPDTPLVGTVVFHFREHHTDPMAMFGRGYVESNFEQAAFCVPWLLVWMPFQPGPLVSMLVGVAGLVGLHITQIHKWAHMDRPPRAVRVLQRLHLLVDAEHHRAHHTRLDTHYGLCAGWMDRVFESLGLLRGLSTVVYLATGHVPLNGGLQDAMNGTPGTLEGRLARWGWSTWYRALAWYSRRTGASFTCMNWGYEDGITHVPPDHADERYAKQLYARLVRGVELRGKRLVEVSSGRGGGLAYLHGSHGPERSTGIDFVPAHVQMGARAFPQPGLAFRVGDAAATGLDAGSADVVINVEASHCYPDFPAFLREVHRVLAPGGVFAFTDFRPAEDVAGVRHAATQAGFQVVSEEDITPQVLDAMRLDADRRRRLVADHASPLLRGVLVNFAGADETADTFRRMQEGRYRYVLMQFRRGTAA